MPIPAAIKEVTAVVRRFRARLEDEGLVGTVRFGRSREKKEQRLASRNRWRMPCDFRLPAPVNSRPLSSGGATSFHLTSTSVTKTAGPKSGGEGVGNGRNAALSFDRYATDQLKVELVEPAIGDRYLEAVKGNHDVDHEEQPEASRAELIASNIGNSQAEREAFWTQCWAAERNPLPPRLELFMERGTEAVWLTVTEDAETPARVAEMARGMAKRTIDEAPRTDRRSRKPCHFIDLIEQAEIEWAEGLKARFGTTRSERIIHYIQPRGGVVQQQFVAELPAELRPSDRCAVVADLAADLDLLKVRYTIVVHAPDERNDYRNYHVHVLIYPGPAEQQKDGSWVFGSACAGRKLRPGDVAEKLLPTALPGRKSDFHNVRAGADMAALRGRFAVYVNARLEACGAERRLDPRTYKKMGIDREPSTHLGTDKGRLVAAGVPVATDIENARKTWDAERRDVDRHLVFRQRLRAAAADRMQVSLARDSVGDDAADAVLRDLAERHAAIRSELDEGLLALSHYDLDLREARSSAERFLERTAPILGALSTGSAAADDRRNEPHIRRRFALAEQHLAEIEETLEPWAEDMAAYRARMADTERELEQIRQAAEELIDKRAAVAAWQKSTVLPLERYPEPLAGYRHVDALLEYMKADTQRDAGRRGGRLVHVLQSTTPDAAFVIHGVELADLNVLCARSFEKRVLPAVANIALRQRQGIDRTHAFIREHGFDNFALGRRRDGSAAPDVMQDGYILYRHHPSFLDGAAVADLEYLARDRAAPVRAGTTRTIAAVDTAVAELDSREVAAGDPIFGDERGRKSAVRQATPAASGELPGNVGVCDVGSLPRPAGPLRQPICNGVRPIDVESSCSDRLTADRSYIVIESAKPIVADSPELSPAHILQEKAGSPVVSSPVLQAAPFISSASKPDDTASRAQTTTDIVTKKITPSTEAKERRRVETAREADPAGGQDARSRVGDDELYRERPRFLSKTRPLSGVRQLSEIGMVRDESGDPVLLQGFSRDNLWRSGAAGDGVRRARARDLGSKERTEAELTQVEAVERAHAPVMAASTLVPKTPASRQMKENFEPRTASPKKVDDEFISRRLLPQPSRRSKKGNLPATVAGISDALSKLKYVPTRLVRSDRNRTAAEQVLMIMPKYAPRAHLDVITRAQRIQVHPLIQEVLRDKRILFLKALDEALEGAPVRQLNVPLSMVLRNEAIDFKDALACAAKDDDVYRVIETARDRWRNAALARTRGEIALEPCFKKLSRFEQQAILAAVDIVIVAVQEDKLRLHKASKNIEIYKVGNEADAALIFLLDLKEFGFAERFARVISTMKLPPLSGMLATSVLSSDNSQAILNWHRRGTVER